MAVDFSEKSAPRPKPAPRGSTAKTQGPKAIPKEVQDRMDSRAGVVNELVGFAQLGSIFKGWYADAATYQLHGPKLAVQTAELAESNAYVGKGLDMLGSILPALSIASIALPMVLQLMVNHKRLPAEPLMNMGVVPPETLEAQAKAEIAKEQLKAIQAQRAAEAELEATIAAAQNLIPAAPQE